MKLKVKVTILKKKSTPSSIIQRLEIFLNDKTKIVLHLQRPTSSHKFRHSPEKIVRVLNLYKKGIEFLSVQVYYNSWTTWDCVDIKKEFEISSSDLLKVRFFREQRRIVEKALDGKIYIKNPSKPKSDMEYRKRAYYGKCKR